VASGQASTLGRYEPVVLGALIGAGSSVIVAVTAFVTSAYNTRQTLAAERKARLWDRRAEVYVKVLARAKHRKASRENQLKAYQFLPSTEDAIQEKLDAYQAPSWFELDAQMWAFASDPVMVTFLASQIADDAIRRAHGDHARIAQANRQLVLDGAAVPDDSAGGRAALEAAHAVRDALNAGGGADSALVNAIPDELHNRKRRRVPRPTRTLPPAASQIFRR
jgi:hypothetical protein